MVVCCGDYVSCCRFVAGCSVWFVACVVFYGIWWLVFWFTGFLWLVLRGWLIWCCVGCGCCWCFRVGWCWVIGLLCWLLIVGCFNSVGIFIS